MDLAASQRKSRRGLTASSAQLVGVTGFGRWWMIRRVGLVVIRCARTMASAGARLCNHVDAFCRRTLPHCSVTSASQRRHVIAAHSEPNEQSGFSR